METGRPFTLTICSCASPDVRAGYNKLNTVGGLQNLQRYEFQVCMPWCWVKLGSRFYRYGP